MNLLIWIIIFTAIGGILSILAASVFLLLPDSKRHALLPHGISLATGALLTVAFGGLIPEAFAQVKVEQFHQLSATILLGILIFFMLEKLLIWRHYHVSDEETYSQTHSHLHYHGQHSAGTLILIGDAIHNFVDGILIAAAFLTDLHLGIVTSLAVATHEIPQEVGDFAILLQSGYAKKQALIFNMLSSLTTVIGGILAYYSLNYLHSHLAYILALAASSFIYIAVADLIPALHQNTDLKTSIQQMLWILTGVLLIGSLELFAH
ncbi:MAG: hypothetical protein RL637_1087 [Pseudomonadota bacterium]|jgi:zinc and cadmium transporter